MSEQKVLRKLYKNRRNDTTLTDIRLMIILDMLETDPRLDKQLRAVLKVYS